jgi:cytochrome c553
VPHLAGQNERYLFNQMMAFRTGKRVHKEMRYMARHMSVAEIAALAAYYAALPPR